MSSHHKNPFLPVCVKVKFTAGPWLTCLVYTVGVMCIWSTQARDMVLGVSCAGLGVGPCGSIPSRDILWSFEALPGAWCVHTELLPSLASKAHGQMDPWFSSSLIPCVDTERRRTTQRTRSMLCPGHPSGLDACTHSGRDNVIPLMKLHPRIISFD